MSSPSNWIRETTRLACLLRDGHRCAYCGVHDEAGLELTLDHLRPRSRGGSNRTRNLITACRDCNSRRQDRPLLAWVGAERAAAIRRQARRRMVRLRRRARLLLAVEAAVTERASEIASQAQEQIDTRVRVEVDELAQQWERWARDEVDRRLADVGEGNAPF